MTNIFHLFLLFSLILLAFSSYRDIKETVNIRKKLIFQRKNFEKKFEYFLQEVGDTRQIFNYFLETKKKKLNENLHNIMLGKALGDDYFAKLYLNELKIDHSKLEEKMRYKCLERQKKMW